MVKAVRGLLSSEFLETFGGLAVPPSCGLGSPSSLSTRLCRLSCKCNIAWAVLFTYPFHTSGSQLKFPSVIPQERMVQGQNVVQKIMDPSLHVISQKCIVA